MRKLWTQAGFRTAVGLGSRPRWSAETSGWTQSGVVVVQPHIIHLSGSLLQLPTLCFGRQAVINRTSYCSFKLDWFCVLTSLLINLSAPSARYRQTMTPSRPPSCRCFQTQRPSVSQSVILRKRCITSQSVFVCEQRVPTDGVTLRQQSNDFRGKQTTEAQRKLY